MPTPTANLPAAKALVDLYVQQDLTYRQIADRYKCSPRTVQHHLERAARQLDLAWPLKSPEKARSGRAGTVVTTMLVAEIRHAVLNYGVTQTQIAEAAGVKINHLHQITSGHRKRVKLATARKIQKGIEKVEAGAVPPAPVPPILPMAVRTHCSKGHPYNGRRGPDGRRLCVICLAEKNRRNDQRRQQRRTTAA